MTSIAIHHPLRDVGTAMLFSGIEGAVEAAGAVAVVARLATDVEWRTNNNPPDASAARIATTAAMIQVLGQARFS